MTTEARDSSYPFLDVREPDGKEYTIDFKDIFEQTPEQTRLTIGRSHDNNIVLPDPHKKISRRHCAIERQGDRWWLVDEGSANGTFLRQQGSDGSEVDVRAVETMLLQDGNVILIRVFFLNLQMFLIHRGMLLQESHYIQVRMVRNCQLA